MLLGLLTLGLLFWVHGLNNALQAQSDGFGAPDLSFGYSPSTLHAIFSSYGDSMAFYRRIEIIDLVLPLVYGFFLALILLRLWRDSDWVWLAILPLNAADFDYSENLTLFILSMLHPGYPNWLVWLSSALNICKFILLGAAFVALVLGILRAFRRFSAKP